MFSPVSVQLLFGKDTSTQKCVVPVKLFEKSNLRIGDYVTLESLDRIYICQLYTSISDVPSLDQVIVLDDVVTLTKSYKNEIINYSEYITFPDNVSAINISKFDRVVIKIIYKENDNILKCSKTKYEEMARKILFKYVIKKDCIIKCSGSNLSDFFHVESIVIMDTFPEEHFFGRLIRSSVVEVADIISSEQMHQLEKFRHLNLGGISRNLRLLKFCFQSKRTISVLVSGLSGCGKTSLVRKFCIEIGCYMVFIDGLKNGELTEEKCNMYTTQISNYLNIFPYNRCILFIDNIDALTCDLKLLLPTLYKIVTLINNLQSLRVFIVATAVHKRNLHDIVSSLFEKEITMGIPSLQERKEMIEALTKSLHCDINYNRIAQITPGFIGHDISLHVEEALQMKQTPDFEEASLTTEDLEKALTKISPSILKTSLWNLKVQPVYWKDIGGMFNEKKKLQMCIEWPLKNPELFKKIDLPCPHGILLFGPPGCCKTTLARGLATECNANFFSANPAQIYSPFVGESEKNITELFYQARISAPSIIFLDELDSLVVQRKLDSKSQGVGERVLSTLLNEMDGFGTTVQFQDNISKQKLVNNDSSIEGIAEEDDSEQNSNDNVIVVGATNRPDLIDSALLRPGRFDVMLYVPPPNTEERESILKTLTSIMPIKGADLKSIAESTNLFSGADLKNLCNEAAMNALRHNKSAEYITKECFDEALKTIQPSITRQQIEMYDNLSGKYGPVIKRL